jgi:hypothetical protein
VSDFCPHFSVVMFDSSILHSLIRQGVNCAYAVLLLSIAIMCIGKVEEKHSARKWQETRQHNQAPPKPAPRVVLKSRPGVRNNVRPRPPVVTPRPGGVDTVELGVFDPDAVWAAKIIARRWRMRAQHSAEQRASGARINRVRGVSNQSMNQFALREFEVEQSGTPTHSYRVGTVNPMAMGRRPPPPPAEFDWGRPSFGPGPPSESDFADDSFSADVI